MAKLKIGEEALVSYLCGLRGHKIGGVRFRVMVDAWEAHKMGYWSPKDGEVGNGMIPIEWTSLNADKT